jgi:crotonobetainyl-CoA:carnitine CoA-transferase CaiB-like acyl-CoA transferase
LFERWPGSKYADHARGNRELQTILRDIFKTKTANEWIALGEDKDFPIAPCNTPKNIVDDPQFKARFPLYPHEQCGADMLPYPVKFPGEELPAPTKAPSTGQHTDDVLQRVLGKSIMELAALRDAGALGKPRT